MFGLNSESEQWPDGLNMDNNNEKTNYGEVQFINHYLKTLPIEVEELCSLLNSVLNKST